MITDQISLSEIDAELFQLKRLLATTLSEKESYLRGNTLAAFVPNKGGQTEFFEHSNKFLRAVFSGNRFGKSTAGCVEDVSWLLGFRPFYPEGHPLRTLGIPDHGVKGLVIASTWEKVRDIFTREGDPTVDDRVGKIFQFLPAGTQFSTVHNQHGVVSQLDVESRVHGRVRRSTLVFDTVRSFLTNPLGKESSDWDFIHVDEPIPKNMWEAVSRGLIDRGGKAWWLMTPLTEPWMYYMATGMEAETPEKCFTYTGDTDENITLTEEAKDNFFGSLSEEALASRKAGKPTALSRMVISNFNEDRHVLKGTPGGWDNPLTPPSDYAIAIATDTHPQTPHATLMAAVSPSGDVFFYKERFEKGAISGTPGSICSWLKDQAEFPRCLYYLLEPGAWNEDQTTGRRFVDDFFEAGISPEKGSKKRSEIIVLLNDFFGRTDRKVYILEHCRVTLKEIRQWYFDKDDRPVDKEDHMMECMGRLLAHDNFKYYQPWVSSVFNSPSLFSNDGLGDGFGDPALMSI